MAKERAKIPLHLPPELHCEIIAALPLEHSTRLLLLSKLIAGSCKSQVKKQREAWKIFSAKSIEQLMARYHSRVLPTMRRIEEEHHSLYIQPAQQQDAFLTEDIAHARATLSPLVGETLVRRAVRGGPAVGQVMNELLNSFVSMHHLVEKSKTRLKHVDEEFNEVKRLADLIKADLVPRDFCSQLLPTATVWATERLLRDYSAHLRSLNAQLRQIKKAYRKKLNKIGVCRQVNEWYDELILHRLIIVEQFKVLQKQKPEEFDICVWRDHMLGELAARNALTIAKPQGAV